MKYRPRGFTRAMCAYYLTDSRMTISCEADCEEAVRRRLEFDSQENKMRYMRGNCFLRESGCPLRAALDKMDK